MADTSSRSLKMAAWLSSLALLLAGVLGWKEVLPPNGILALAALAIGGFVAVALKDRWKRIRWGGRGD
jgi:hypothetical protein